MIRSKDLQPKLHANSTLGHVIKKNNIIV